MLSSTFNKLMASTAIAVSAAISATLFTVSAKQSLKKAAEKDNDEFEAWKDVVASLTNESITQSRETENQFQFITITKMVKIDRQTHQITIRDLWTEQPETPETEKSGGKILFNNIR